uniref:Uncharacterized protein n=1 Tax=Chromera velia CCMP2878 TaxID=1169474 RepID=A0A0G4IE65_9ALVE|eukprot:Cvel_13518.t1-p1 / transcript=Cvel_13518.t1 / gene=Cvel_13518 / organism=Chromera_velia_CCMP2878 / gene_product=hypothetical protein / transcript_product=hypothetical protein / location=Cvel_scaffold927:27963-32652(+) / protein_length=341 / sequence_SO=supercontig / SO=protein_coding / is_pseudo=false
MQTTPNSTNLQEKTAQADPKTPHTVPALASISASTQVGPLSLRPSVAVSAASVCVAPLSGSSKEDTHSPFHSAPCERGPKAPSKSPGKMRFSYLYSQLAAKLERAQKEGDAQAGTIGESDQMRYDDLRASALVCSSSDFSAFSDDASGGSSPGSPIITAPPVTMLKEEDDLSPLERNRESHGNAGTGKSFRAVPYSCGQEGGHADEGEGQGQSLPCTVRYRGDGRSSYDSSSSSCVGFKVLTAKEHTPRDHITRERKVEEMERKELQSDSIFLPSQVMGGCRGFSQGASERDLTRAFVGDHGGRAHSYSTGSGSFGNVGAWSVKVSFSVLSFSFHEAVLIE